MLHRKSSSGQLAPKPENSSGQLTIKPENAGAARGTQSSVSLKQLPTSFAELSLSAKKRTRLLIEVTAFVSAVSNIQLGPEYYGSNALSYEETARVGNTHQPWVEILYKQSKAWFDQVPDKELSLAVDILRRTRNMIRNRFSGALAEKSCDLPARVTFSHIRARNLEPRDYKHSPGSYCVMKMDGLMYRTSSQKSLNPVWEEVFEFIVQDLDSVMSISVWDDFVDEYHSDHAFGKVYLFTSDLLRAEPCFFEKKLLDSLGNHAGFIGMRLQCEEIDTGGVEESPDCSAVEVAALTRILWILGVPKEICIQIIRIITRVVSPRETVEILGPVQTYIAVHLCEHFWVAEIFSHWKAFLMTQQQRKIAARLKFEQEQYVKTNRWDVRVRKLQAETSAHDVAADIKKYLEANTLSSSDEENLRLARDFVRRSKPPVADPEKAASLAAKFQDLDMPDGILADGQVRQARDIVAELLALFEREALFFLTVQVEVTEILRRMQSEQSADTTGRAAPADPSGEGYAAMWASIKKRCTKEGRTQEEAQADFLGSKKFRITKHIRQAAVDLWSFLCASRQRHVRREIGQLILEVVKMEKTRVEEQAAAERRRLRILGEKAEMRTLEMRGAQDRAVNACMSWLVLHEERVMPAVRDELVQLISHFRENLSRDDAGFQEREEALVHIRALKDAEVQRLSEYAKSGLGSQKKSMTPAEASAASARLLALFRARSERSDRGEGGGSIADAEEDEIASLTQAMMLTEGLDVVEEEQAILPAATQSQTETLKHAPVPMKPTKQAAKRKKKKKAEVIKAKMAEEEQGGKELRTAGSPPVRKVRASPSRKIVKKSIDLKSSKRLANVQTMKKDGSSSWSADSSLVTEAISEIPLPVADSDGASWSSGDEQKQNVVDSAADSSEDVSDSENILETPVDAGISEIKDGKAFPNEIPPSISEIHVEERKQDVVIAAPAMDNSQTSPKQDNLHPIQDKVSTSINIISQDKEEIQNQAIAVTHISEPLIPIKLPEKLVDHDNQIPVISKRNPEKSPENLEQQDTPEPDPFGPSDLIPSQLPNKSVSQDILSNAVPSVAKSKDFSGVESGTTLPSSSDSRVTVDTPHVPDVVSELESEQIVLLPKNPEPDQTCEIEWKEQRSLAENQPQVDYSTDSENHSISSESDNIDWLVVEEGLRDFADDIPQSLSFALNRVAINTIKNKAIFALIRNKPEDLEASYCQGIGLHRQSNALLTEDTGNDPLQDDVQMENGATTPDYEDFEYEQLLHFQAAARRAGIEHWFSNKEVQPKRLPLQSASSSEHFQKRPTSTSSTGALTESELFLLSQYAYQQYLKARSSLQQKTAEAVKVSGRRVRLPFKFLSYLIDQDMILTHNVMKGRWLSVVWKYHWNQLCNSVVDEKGNVNVFVQNENDARSYKLFTLSETTWLKFNQLRKDILNLQLPRSDSSTFFPLGEPTYIESTRDIFILPSRFGYDFQRYLQALTLISQSNEQGEMSPFFVTQLKADHAMHAFVSTSKVALRPVEMRKVCFLQSAFRRTSARKIVVNLQVKQETEFLCSQIVWDVVDRIFNAFQATDLVLASLSSEVRHAGQDVSNFVYNILPMHSLDPSIGLDVDGLMKTLSARQLEKETERLLRVESQRIQSSIEDSRRMLRNRAGFVQRSILSSQQTAPLTLVGQGSTLRDRLNSGNEGPYRFPRRWRDDQAEYFVENRGRLIQGQVESHRHTRSIPAGELSRALKRSHGHVYRQPAPMKPKTLSPRWPSNGQSNHKNNDLGNVDIL